MRIISLNLWHGKLRAPLANYLSNAAASTDIFCFQEADLATRDYLRPSFPGFRELASDRAGDRHSAKSIVTYVKTPLVKVHSFQTITTPAGSLVTHLQLEAGHSVFALCNVHGISYHGIDSKLDDPNRVAQTKAILDFYRNADTPVVIVGDFNMLPEANSIRAFAQAGYRNLITDHHIKTTRNHYAWDLFPGSPQYFADFAFLSPDLKPDSFTIPQDLVSDHQPMVIDLAIPVPARVL